MQITTAQMKKGAPLTQSESISKVTQTPHSQVAESSFPTVPETFFESIRLSRRYYSGYTGSVEVDGTRRPMEISIRKLRGHRSQVFDPRSGQALLSAENLSLLKTGRMKGVVIAMPSDHLNRWERPVLERQLPNDLIMVTLNPGAQALPFSPLRLLAKIFVASEHV